MISPTTIEHVRDLPIEEVIGRYTDLKKAGANFKGCCPLHDEKTPSFMVSPAKNIFKCFGCGRGGDGIEFVMQKEGLTFQDAVIEIAKAHSIGIEYTEAQGKTPEQVQEEQIFTEWLHKANAIYTQAIRN